MFKKKSGQTGARMNLDFIELLGKIAYLLTLFIYLYLFIYVELFICIRIFVCSVVHVLFCFVRFLFIYLCSYLFLFPLYLIVCLFMLTCKIHGNFMFSQNVLDFDMLSQLHSFNK